MSSFNTYSTDKKVVDFVIRNIRKFNGFFILSYVAIYMSIIFMKDIISNSSTIYLLLFLPGVVIAIIGFLLVNKFKKDLRAVGKLKFENNNIVLNSSGKDILLNANDIRKINVVRWIKHPFSPQDYQFVLADIVVNDADHDNLIISKYSDVNNFEILKTHESYSQINGINYPIRDSFSSYFLTVNRNQKITGYHNPSYVSWASISYCGFRSTLFTAFSLKLS